MKKILSLFVLVVVMFSVSSCDYIPNLKKRGQVVVAPDSTYSMAPVDTLRLALEALRNKPIMNGFQQEGELHVDTLIYIGYSTSSLGQDFYHFINESDEEVKFDRNDTRWQLTRKSVYPTTENKGLVANPAYLTKSLLVVWRNLSLMKQVLDNNQYIDENLKEIIYLKEVYEAPLVNGTDSM